MSEEIKDIMDALENNELKNDGFWGRACSRLSQQLKTAKEENEKLKEDKITKDDLRRELNYQCEVVERLKEEMEFAPLCVQSCNVDCEIKQLREENETLTQQNKQMREALEKIKIAMQNKQNLFRQKNIFGNIYDICIQALKGGE